MIYLDVGGQGPGLVAAERALIPASDRGFLYGDGLFETALAQDGRAPLLPMHLARLVISAHALGIPIPTRIGQAAAEVARAAGPGEHAIRITLSRGAGPGRGYAPPQAAQPTLLITASPYQRPTGPFGAIVAQQRLYPASPAVQHKSLSCLEWVMAKAEADRAGANEALILNVDGRVAQGATTNLFICREGRWITPPQSEGALPGVMRHRLIRLADAVEAPITVAELDAADGVYLTNALLGCVPLQSLDGRPLPLGPAPPTLEALLSVG